MKTKFSCVFIIVLMCIGVSGTRAAPVAGIENHVTAVELVMPNDYTVMVIANVEVAELLTTQTPVSSDIESSALCMSALYEPSAVVSGPLSSCSYTRIPSRGIYSVKRVAHPDYYIRAIKPDNWRSMAKAPPNC